LTAENTLRLYNWRKKQLPQYRPKRYAIRSLTSATSALINNNLITEQEILHAMAARPLRLRTW